MGRNTRVQRSSSYHKRGKRSPQPLDERELTVLRLTAEGANGRAIARRLGISDLTVSGIRTRIRAKLNLPHNASLDQLLAEARRRGFIEEAS